MINDVQSVDKEKEKVNQLFIDNVLTIIVGAEEGLRDAEKTLFLLSIERENYLKELDNISHECYLKRPGKEKEEKLLAAMYNQLGLKQFRTPLKTNLRFDDKNLLDALKEHGAEIQYMTERTIDLEVEGIRIHIGHNWSGQKFVMSQVSGPGISEGERLEKEIKRVIESVNN